MVQRAILSNRHRQGSCLQNRVVILSCGSHPIIVVVVAKNESVLACGTAWHVAAMDWVTNFLLNSVRSGGTEDTLCSHGDVEDVRERERQELESRNRIGGRKASRNYARFGVVWQCSIFRFSYLSRGDIFKLEGNLVLSDSCGELISYSSWFTFSS